MIVIINSIADIDQILKHRRTITGCAAAVHLIFIQNNNILRIICRYIRRQPDIVITAVTAGRTVNLACTGFAPNADTLTIHNKIHPGFLLQRLTFAFHGVSNNLGCLRAHNMHITGVYFLFLNNFTFAVCASLCSFFLLGSVNLLNHMWLCNLSVTGSSHGQHRHMHGTHLDILLPEGCPGQFFIIIIKVIF